MRRPFTRLFKTGHAGFLLFTLHCCAAAGMDSRPSDVQPGAVCLLFQLSEALCMHATPFHTRIGEIRWEGERGGGGGGPGGRKWATEADHLPPEPRCRCSCSADCRRDSAVAFGSERKSAETEREDGLHRNKAWQRFCNNFQDKPPMCP